MLLPEPTFSLDPRLFAGGTIHLGLRLGLLLRG
jgi:hypothetical protein